MSNLNNKSKFLSLILRHKPQTIGLSLTNDGWADVQELIDKSDGTFTFDILKRIVQECPKKRYSFSEDGKRIKANQGHSLSLDLKFEQKVPPTVLYHGTAKKNFCAIRQNGLSKMKRHHVHLSEDLKVAIDVGKRHGEPIVFIIDAKEMNDDGILFYQSENGVWLTEFIDPKYITFYEA